MRIIREALELINPGGEQDLVALKTVFGEQLVELSKSFDMEIELGSENMEYPHKTLSFRKFPHGDYNSREEMEKVARNFVEFLEKSGEVSFVLTVHDATSAPNVPLHYYHAKGYPILFGKAVGSGARDYLKEKIKAHKSYL